MPLTCWPSGLRDEGLQPIQRRIMGRCDATTKYQLQGDWTRRRWRIRANTEDHMLCICPFVCIELVCPILWPKEKKNNGLYLPVKRVGRIVFSVTCRQSDCCGELWKQQVFTQRFTPPPTCYIKYSHMQRRRFPRLKWQLISQGNVTKRVRPKSFFRGKQTKTLVRARKKCEERVVIMKQFSFCQMVAKKLACRNFLCL